ncbi:MAG: penicillin-binding protein activator LpoB [Planctomycetota bacterium]
MPLWKLVLLSLSPFVILSGCATYAPPRIPNAAGRPTVYENPASPGAVTGVGLESQDIVSATDRMVRDILATPVIAARQTPPRIVMDSSYFKNESSSVVNTNLLTDRFRTQLSRAAGPKMVFLARHYADMVEKERLLEQEGIVTEGTQGRTKQAYGYDYRLGGRIASLDAVDVRTGLKSRYHQITFELVERGSGVMVWSEMYEFKKAAWDSILYR